MFGMEDETMRVKQVNLTDKHWKFLAAKAKKEKVSEAEIVRRALDDLIKRLKEK